MELLTTVGVVAVVCSMASPIMRSGKVALAQHQAMVGIKQLSLVTNLYLADSDETYPLGMSKEPDGSLRTWFGLMTATSAVKTNEGSLSPYLGKNPPQDPTAPKLPFMGNGSGFGYNYETLGSDLSETNDFSHYPDCENPASVSTLSEPSGTIAFATSVFYRAPWDKDGDGQAYEFGFLTPPSAWKGNPTMSFRHQGDRIVRDAARKTFETGNALVLFADGSAKPLRLDDVTDKLFLRNPASFSAN